ncbi:MAG: glycosyltransferase family 2 protein [Acidobacteria bacterium]|nr:glycosyltransferase family 2 protein [Acidobacteriota bacterium]
MNEPLVSVIVPTYNRAYCLGATLDSVLQQTYPHVELIVIDDGSTDGTAELIARDYAQDKRVRYVRQANAGVVAARNHGLRLAQGDFVALLDSDDVWHLWKLEAQLAVMRARPEVGMVWTDMEAVNDAGEKISTAYLRTMYSAYRWFSTPEAIFARSLRCADLAPTLQLQLGERRAYYGDIFSLMMLGSLVHTSTVLLRRECREQVGFFRDELAPSGEDYDFHLRTCRAGKVAYLDASAIIYQVGRPDQLTRPELKLTIARHSLKAIEPFLENERHLIQLPKWMLRETLALTHYCIGEHAMNAGLHGEALRSFFRSLRYDPWQFRVYAFLPMALLPLSLANGLRRIYRGLKGVLKKGVDVQSIQPS